MQRNVVTIKVVNFLKRRNESALKILGVFTIHVRESLNYLICHSTLHSNYSFVLTRLPLGRQRADSGNVKISTALLF